MGRSLRAEPASHRDLPLEPPSRQRSLMTSDWGSLSPEEGEAKWFGSLRIERTGERPDSGHLSIPGGNAFGSGFHPSTVLILNALAERRPQVEVLDVGTGTGILALAALRFGAPSAVGVETQAEARDEARRNAELNQLETRLKLAATIPEHQRFRFAMANILAPELRELAPQLARSLASDGTLWLSGLSAGQADEVAETYRKLGLFPVGRRSEEGWWALELTTSW